eukprot:320513-Chlamydomonas_euryale.AAC.1
MHPVPPDAPLASPNGAAATAAAAASASGMRPAAAGSGLAAWPSENAVELRGGRGSTTPPRPMPARRAQGVGGASSQVCACTALRFRVSDSRGQGGRGSAIPRWPTPAGRKGRAASFQGFNPSSV